ncbi:tRNA(His) guanylyltransferase 1-like isoform X2 [Ananas comosus]|uniref:tRNA(His) guanylyltransferase n=1 Tax=Ananas comosus TaxID=4615 RepID=A0A6P5FQD4_ANACO|nr:tRNA(His) guanylyltransferase 1-like isoform X2 [Ananas comosus]
MANSKFEYVKDFETDDRLPRCNWIVVRIDGCHFHQFSADHAFEKPNDENALNLMNACAVSMLEQFPDIVFAYGVSDEYSFVLKEASQFYQRRARLSHNEYFHWKEFFPHKDLKRPPFFDGRVVCYPRAKIIRDYLSWRQVDCHINNQYNTCFWMLVKSGKTEREAQEMLKGTLSKDKNELLFQQFGVNYDKVPAMFRKGSCVYRDKVEEIVKFDESRNPVRRIRKKVVLGHFDIIGPNFWHEHPEILEED